MKLLVDILAAIIRVLLPAIVRELTPTSEDAQRQPELKRRLRERIRERWSKS